MAHETIDAVLTPGELLFTAKLARNDMKRGDSGAVYRNDPLFNLVIDLVEQAGILVDSPVADASREGN